MGLEQVGLGLDTQTVTPEKPKPPPMPVERALDELVGSLTDPIIVWPGGWEDTLPPWIKQAIRIERLIENLRASKEGNITATDAEACAYMYTVCTCQLVNDDWTTIYQYLVTKVYKSHRTKDSGVEVPKDIRIDELTEQQTRLLNELKRFIYAARVKNRQEKRRAGKRAEKERKEQEQQELPL